MLSTERSGRNQKMKNNKRNEEMMRASIRPGLGGAEQTIVKEIPKPIPKEHQILIKVNHALVSPTDCSMKKEDPLFARFLFSLFKSKNKVYGEMYTGVIEKLGSSVIGFEVNDEVYGTNMMKLGAYAEYICVKDTTVIRKVPQGIKPEDVVTLIDGGITSLPFLRDKGEIIESQKVLIIGASGSVGSMGVQIAKHFKAHVTGVCSTENIDLVKSLGADQVIDYKVTDYTKQDIKYDIIYDAVGKSTFSACKDILKDEGRYMTTVPTLSSLWKLIFKVNQPGKKNLTAATGLRKQSLKHQDLEYLERLLKENIITPLIDSEYTLEEMPKALKRVDSGHKKGSVVIHI